MLVFTSRRRFANRVQGLLAGLLAAALLTSCGGGLYLGYEIGNGDGRAPSVALASSVDSAAAGQTVRLSAAAVDYDGIDQVSFYRFDGNVAALLGGDGTAPFQWDAVIPVGTTGAVSFYAQATDGSGDRANSNVVTVTVVP